MDLSLDDIIKKNNGRRGPTNSRGRSQNTPLNRRNNAGSRPNKPPMRSNGRINKPQRQPTRGSVKARGPLVNKNGLADARFKIIQKTRGRLTDARDKLSEIAKQTDARSRIQGRRNHPGVPKLNGRRDLGREQRGMRGRNGGMNVKPPAILQRSIQNNLVRPNFPHRPFRNNLADIRDDSLIRCTINRPMSDYNNYDVPLPHEDMEYALPMRPHELSSIKVVTQNEYLQYNQEYVPEPMCLEIDSPPPPPVFSRQREPPRSLTQGRMGAVRMSQEMRARLDSPTRPSYVPPEGYRIVVSNLHATVTHEDIKELFEDIGPLLTSRLVRAGTAEVIYKQQKDAKKAVEAYHNRQLDGQPMKCLLVMSRGSTPSSGALRSSNLPPPPKFPNSSKSQVVPDLSAIHKALFTSK